MNASRNRRRIATDQAAGKKMPPAKVSAEVGGQGGKPIRSGPGSWFRQGITFGVRLG